MFRRIVGKFFGSGKSALPVQDRPCLSPREQEEGAGRDVGSFFALYEGLAPGTDADESGALRFSVQELGTLVCPTGKIEASDPLGYLGVGLALELAPGAYPVRVTLVREGEHAFGFPAYLSLVVSEAPWERVESATDTSLWDKTRRLGHFDSLVGVDSGTVGFADVGALPLVLPAGQDAHSPLVPGGILDEERLSVLLDLMPEDCMGSIQLPGGARGENLIVCRSGMGDGVYEVLVTYAADGEPTGVHFDFGLLESEETEALS